MARIASSMAVRGSENVQSYLALDLSGKVYFTIKYAVSCRIFIDVLYKVKDVLFYS